MPAAVASSTYPGACDIHGHSQIAIIFASPEFRKTGNDPGGDIPQFATMDDADEKNGGPNHLRAWMRYRNINGQKLAAELGGNVTPGMVSDLANSKRALSAKWLRRLAVPLKTNAGLLLDHDPHDLPADILEIWIKSTEGQRRQLVDVAKAIVRTGTDD